MEKAASKRQQSRGEGRQNGEHTHYKILKRDTVDAPQKSRLVPLLVAKLQH
jgi:hypothetical protein